jgi:hypothetical protein
MSQIRACDTYHLADAATAWRTTADQWEETFSHVARQMPAPTGIQSEGAGAEGAQLRAHTDQVTVRGTADSLRSASTVAGEGANEIYAARQSVLYAVEGAGFTVREDLSVISRQTGGPPAVQAARQAHAQALSADIRAKAAALTATDQEVAARVTTAAAGLRGVTLGDGQSLAPYRDATQRKPRFEAVDQHGWRQGPGGGGEPPLPPPDPAVRGLPPDGIRPPVPGKLTPGPASRPSEQAKAARVFGTTPAASGATFLATNTTIRHWDFNPHNTPNAPWENVPIDNLPPVKVQPPPEPPPAEPPPPEIGEGGIGGIGGGPYIGPTFVPAPHSKHGIPILGKDDLDPPGNTKNDGSRTPVRAQFSAVTDSRSGARPCDKGVRPAPRSDDKHG